MNIIEAHDVGKRYGRSWALRECTRRLLLIGSADTLGLGLRLTWWISMERVDIESIPLFAGLSADDRSRVAAVTRAVDFAVGQVVVNEGEFAFDFYGIRQGAAEVQRRGERIGTLGPGDVFGEMGVVPNDAHRWTRRRAATVIVTAPTQAVVIDGSDFRRLTEDIPTLRDAVRTTATARSLESS